MSTKIKSFTKPSLNIVRRALEAKLAEIEKELGVAIKVGNMRFNEDTFTTKLSAAVSTGARKGIDAVAKANWDKNCIFFGMKKSDFNKKVNIQGSEYKITGIKPRSKNAILCTKTANGQTYKVSPDMVKIGLSK